MPNRYEREIEEILRNLEHPEPTTSGQKSGLRRRPSPLVPPRSRRSFSLHFTPVEWLLVVAVAAALLSGGYAFATTPSIFTGLLACVAVVCLILIALSQFLFSPRSRQPNSYGTITNMTPISRNPLTRLRTQVHLFLLKLRYRNRGER